jgi:hypothetical protein
MVPIYQTARHHIQWDRNLIIFIAMRTSHLRWSCAFRPSAMRCENGKRERREVSGGIGTAESDLWTYFRQKQVTGLHCCVCPVLCQACSETSARSILFSLWTQRRDTTAPKLSTCASPLMSKLRFHSHTELQVKLYVALPGFWNFSFGWYIE